MPIGMLCLADEAHGTHFYFGDKLPAVSHGGRSRYGCGFHAQIRRKPDPEFPASDRSGHVSEGHVRQIINLTQTTSGSYLLLSSLDISRRNLALAGKGSF